MDASHPRVCSASLLLLQRRLSSRRLGLPPMFSSQLLTTGKRNKIITNIKLRAKVFYSGREELKTKKFFGKVPVFNSAKNKYFILFLFSVNKDPEYQS